MVFLLIGSLVLGKSIDQSNIEINILQKNSKKLCLIQNNIKILYFLDAK